MRRASSLPAEVEADSDRLKNPGKVRGWLLVFVLLLAPHGISSVLALFVPGLRDAAGVHGFETALLAFTAVGNWTGIYLILSRSRVAPAFFTLYPPALVGLNLLIPDLLGRMNARLVAFGGSADLGAGELAVIMGVNVAVVVLMVGYWMRSKRVLDVYGTTGLGVLRKRRNA